MNKHSKIETEEQYDEYLDIVSKLMDRDNEEDYDELIELSDLISDYEDKYYPM